MDSSKIFMVLTNGFDPDVRVFKEAKFLVNLGYNVEILCWDRKGDYIDRAEENIEGIYLKRFHIPSVLGSGIKQLLPFFKYIMAIRKYLKKQEFEYLYCHDFDGMFAGYSATLFRKIKYIFDMHETYSAKLKLLVKYFIKKSKKTVYVNDDQLKFLGLDKNEKLIHLPNYPEEINYLPVEKEKSEALKINYIGYLRDYEALKTLMDVAKEKSDLEVGLYGIGVSYQKLKEENTLRNVKIYGKFDGINEISEIYRKTDILYCVYNPQIENWRTAYPVKLYEALITKTPVIVCKDTRAGEFVEENNIGQTVEYGNRDSLNEAIEKIKEHYDTYVKNLGKIRDTYKWEGIVKNLEKIFID